MSETMLAWTLGWFMGIWYMWVMHILLDWKRR